MNGDSACSAQCVPVGDPRQVVRHNLSGFRLVSTGWTMTEDLTLVELRPDLIRLVSSRTPMKRTGWFDRYHGSVEPSAVTASEPRTGPKGYLAGAELVPPSKKLTRY